MTVRELMERLSEFPPDLYIEIDNEEINGILRTGLTVQMWHQADQLEMILPNYWRQ